MKNRIFLLVGLLVVVIISLLGMAAFAPIYVESVPHTLGGDCSANNATGDLYPNHPDFYCQVIKGEALPAPEAHERHEKIAEEITEMTTVDIPEILETTTPPDDPNDVPPGVTPAPASEKQKTCKNGGDNFNRQGKHNCSADHPAAASGQLHTKPPKPVGDEHQPDLPHVPHNHGKGKG